MAWWDTYEGRQRLAVEKAMMLQTYGKDNVKLCRDRDKRELYWMVSRNVPGKGRHTIKVVYPVMNDYPDKAPRSYMFDPPLKYPNHQYSDGVLCIFNWNESRSNGWDPAVSTAVTIAAWSFEWVDAYYEQKRTGKWPGRGGR